MTETNLILVLKEALEKLHPTANVVVSKPAHIDGWWFLDIDKGDRRVVAQWSIGSIYVGVTLIANGLGYGESADEVFAGVDDASQRIGELLCSR